MKTETQSVEHREAAKGMVRMYTTLWCPDCYRAKSFLKQRGVAFEEINIEHSEGAEEFVMGANQGKRRLPTFEVNGRTFHCSPYDPQKLTRELGLE
ncbi:MAG TPA: glutaredoxin family protein [Terriglobia bacterium]